MHDLVAGLDYDKNGLAANAIMTTDTVKKEAAVSFKIGDKVCHLGGMAKGSGMIHPNMATTLNFYNNRCCNFSKTSSGGIIRHCKSYIQLSEC